MVLSLKRGFTTASVLIAQLCIMTIMLLLYRLLAQNTVATLHALRAHAELSGRRSIVRIAERYAFLLKEKEKSTALIIKELDGHVVCNASRCFAYRSGRMIFSCKRKNAFMKKQEEARRGIE